MQAGRLQDKKYFVQSKDFFSFPLEEKDLRLFQEQFLELLSEEWEEERDIYDSLEEAIQRHDEDLVWAGSLGIDE